MDLYCDLKLLKCMNEMFYDTLRVPSYYEPTAIFTCLSIFQHCIVQFSLSKHYDIPNMSCNLLIGLSAISFRTYQLYAQSAGWYM